MATQLTTDAPAVTSDEGDLAAEGSGRAELKGIIAVSFATAIWSITGALVKSVAVPALVISFYRLVISVPALVALVKLKGRTILRGPFKWAIAGGIAFALHQVMFFEALKLTTIANVTLIGALQPAMVAIVSLPLFGERVTRTQAFWIASAIFGVSLAVFGSIGSPAWSGWGDVLAFGNIVAFTGYFLISKQARKTMDTARYNLLMTATAALLITVLCVLTTQPVFDNTRSEWIVLFVIALIPGTMGHLAVNWAHPRVPAATSSMILLGLPVLSIAIGWVTLGEGLTLVGIIGCALALFSIGAMVQVATAKGAVDELELESTAA